jgi:hypothetical protein
MELRQNRDLTPAELRGVEREWGLLLLDNMSRSRWYPVLAYLTYAFVGFLVLSVAMAVFSIEDGRPYLAPQLAFALAGSVACLIAADGYSRRLQRRIFWDRHRAGDRYLLGDRALETSSAEYRLALSWGGITRVANNDRRLVLLIGNSGVVFIVKAAFDGQDTEAFCAELVRRWQEGRAGTTPGFSA